MRYRGAATLVLIVAILGVFWPVQNYDFVWDDRLFIYDNQYLIPPSVDNTLHFWTQPKWLYIPITYTAWSIVAWLSQYFPAEPYGLNPGLFHTANLLVHILSVLVVFGILRLLLRHGFRESEGENDDDGVSIELAAGVGALIFAIHPVQVETVAWISELKDLLCGLFSFIAIKEYLAYAIASKSGIKGGAKNGHYAIASAALILALLSKPAAVIVPLVALILDRFAIKRDFKKSAVALIGWFIVAGVFAIVAKTVQQSGYVIVSPPLWARPFIAGDALAFYLYKLVFPLQLGIDYGRNPDYVLGQWWLYATWFVPAALLMEIWILKRRVPLLVSFGLFTVSLLPVLGFTPFLFQNHSTVADHYLYIPMLGVALCVSWLILNHQTKAVGLLCAAAVLLFGIRSSLQVPAWQDGIALYTSAIKVNRSSALSHNNLGLALESRGKFNEAVINYKRAVEINPRYDQAYYNMGKAFEDLGKVDEAITSYQKAVEVNPFYVKAYYNLGNTLSDMGRLDEAVRNYEKAIAHNLGYVKAYYNLGITLVEQRKLEEAVSRFRQTIKMKPDHLEAHINLGIVLSAQNKLNDAVVHFREALRINPDYAKTNEQLGLALLKQDQIKEAVHHLNKAVEIQPNYAEAHYYLGIAYRKQGDLTKAVRHFGKALAMRPGFKQAKKQLEMAILQSRGDKR